MASSLRVQLTPPSVLLATKIPGLESSVFDAAKRRNGLVGSIAIVASVWLPVLRLTLSVATVGSTATLTSGGAPTSLLRSLASPVNSSGSVIRPSKVGPGSFRFRVTAALRWPEPSTTPMPRNAKRASASISSAASVTVPLAEVSLMKK